jgi:UDP-N-acetylmuramoylalanine--D-glutamate ligase
MKNPELHGGSFLIVGYGREGTSVHAFLKARLPHARIAIADRRGVKPEDISESDAHVYAGESYLREADTFDTIVRSPGVPLREIQSHCGATTHITSAANIFFAECPGTTIGITGTKGKSTTASLIAHILRLQHEDVRLVGNIGAPMLDYLADASAETYFVLELSSYQLEDLRTSPAVAVMLNIVPEHLDYHGSFENYCAAKLNIARHQTPNNICIINDNFPCVTSLAEACASQRITFREAPDCEALVSVVNGSVVLRGKDEILPVSDIPLLGPGNLQNVLAASTCCAALGVSSDLIRRGITTFQSLEHRLEFVAERRGVRFYNDSLSTIPEALAHALVALGDDVETVIAGGYDRGVSMDPVGPALAASKVKTLILLPTTGEKIFEAAVRAAPHKEYQRIDAHSMQEAVEAAYKHTSPGKICVMSPAASSFSLFRDYRERGEAFKEAVLGLVAP